MESRYAPRRMGYETGMPEYAERRAETLGFYPKNSDGDYEGLMKKGRKGAGRFV